MMHHDHHIRTEVAHGRRQKKGMWLVRNSSHNVRRKVWICRHKSARREWDHSYRTKARHSWRRRTAQKIDRCWTNPRMLCCCCMRLNEVLRRTQGHFHRMTVGVAAAVALAMTLVVVRMHVRHRHCTYRRSPIHGRCRRCHCCCAFKSSRGSWKVGRSRLLERQGCSGRQCRSRRKGMGRRRGRRRRVRLQRLGNWNRRSSDCLVGGWMGSTCPLHGMAVQDRTGGIEPSGWVVCMSNRKTTVKELQLNPLANVRKRHWARRVAQLVDVHPDNVIRF